MLVITRPGTCFVQAIHESEVCRTALRLLRPNNALYRCWSDRKRYWFGSNKQWPICRWFTWVYLLKWWFSMAMLNNQRVYIVWIFHQYIYIYVVWIWNISKIILSLDLNVSSPVLGTWELLPDFSGIHSQGILQVNKEYSDITWLVVSNMFYFPFSIWGNPSHWRTPSFFRG